MWHHWRLTTEEGVCLKMKTYKEKERRWEIQPIKRGKGVKK